MRLTEYQRNIIREVAHKIFGLNAEVRLFGSRVDDAKRGGDIDLLIKTDLPEAMQVARAEIKFLTQIEVLLGEQKIDVLLDYPGRRNYPPIFEIANKTGLLL